MCNIAAAVLFQVATAVFEDLQLFSSFNIPLPVFNTWLVQVNKAYFDNPCVSSCLLSLNSVRYHNALHAADVTQVCFLSYYLLENRLAIIWSELMERISLEILIC